MGAIKAVFRSWDNPRANVYRRDNDIPYSWGTAVNVQEMVFGNWSDESGTGVAFTRDPGDRRKEAHGRISSQRSGRRRGWQASETAADRVTGRGNAGGSGSLKKCAAFRNH